MCDAKKSVARTIIEQFNSKAPKQVDIDQFFEALSGLGAVDDASFSLLKWEDLEDAGLPRLLARRVASEAFRVAPETPQHVILAKNGTTAKIKGMSLRELLEAYSPKDRLDPHRLRLSKVSDGKRFLVYLDESDQLIDVNVSLELLEEIMDGLQEREYYTDVRGVRKVYSVNDKPRQILDEHPLYPGECLRNGKSLKGLDWSKIDEKAKKLLRVCITDKVIDTDIWDEHDLYDFAEKGYDHIGLRYASQAIKLEGMIASGTDPKMKIIKDQNHQTKSNNPFSANKKY